MPMTAVMITNTAPPKVESVDVTSACVADAVIFAILFYMNKIDRWCRPFMLNGTV